MKAVLDPIQGKDCDDYQGIEGEGAVTLDLSKGEEECARVMQLAAKRGVGFFFAKNHGIPPSILEDLRSASTTFFDQEDAFKKSFVATNPKHSIIGYKNDHAEGVIVEKESQSKPDFREHFRLARKRLRRDFYQKVLGDDYVETSNADDESFDWLDEEHEGVHTGQLDADLDLSSLKKKVETYYPVAFKLARKMHRIVALSLDLPANHLDKQFSRPLDILMLNRYPPVRLDESQGEVAMGAHCDFAFTTLLLTDGVPGLQVCKDKTKPVHEREWVSITPEDKDTFIINFGDALEAFTNGRYTSVLHRVINEEGLERKSYPFFCEPNADASFYPMVLPGETQKYEPIPAYGQYLAEKFCAISEEVV